MTILASLKSRLIAVPSAILLVGLAALVGFDFYRAQIRVQTETGSGMRLARILVDAVLANVRAAADPAAALAAVDRALPTIRHVDLIVLPPPAPFAFGGVPVVKEERRDVPAWFVRLFDVSPRASRFPIVANERTVGQVVVVSNPLDEVAEIWDELKFLAALLVALAAIIVAFLVWSASLALRPIRDLAEALDRLEHGRFDEIARPIRITELRPIGARFNSLARSLDRVTADNHRLIDRLMSVQEAERKEVARELHDEFGPSLFGIRADVSCIVRWSRNNEPRYQEIEERARSIAELVDGIQRINARMLDRLRPLVLDQMGLAEALRQLVRGWQDRYPDIAWSLDLPPALAVPEEAGLTLYRVVQECLTNIVRHAGAGSVDVTVRHVAADASRGSEGIAVSVRDDGRGLPADLGFGFGLLGMAERVRARAGRLHVGNAPGGGTVVEVFIPLEPAGAGR